MNRTAIISELEKDFNLFDDKTLEEIFHYAKFLKNRSEIDPTIEILENDEYRKSIEAGLVDKKEGLLHNWEDVK